MVNIYSIHKNDNDEYNTLSKDFIKKTSQFATINDNVLMNKDIAKALELPPIKLHCSVLAEDSIRQVIIDWERKKEHRTHNHV